MAIVVKRRRNPRNTTRIYSMAVIAAVVVVAILVVAFSGNGGEKDEVPETPSLNEAMPVRQEPVAMIVKEDLDEPMAGVADVTSKPTLPYAESNSDQELEERQVAEAPEEAPKPKRRAGVRVVDKEGNDVFKARPELKTKTDKFLFSILSRPMGSGRVTLTTYKIEEDFLKSLEASVEIMPTDTDEEIAIKQEVEGWKQYLKEQMDAGVPLAELMDDLKAQVNLAAEEHASARRRLYQLVKEGNIDAAMIYLDEANKDFEERGILPLHIPQRLLERGAARAR